MEQNLYNILNKALLDNADTFTYGQNDKIYTYATSDFDVSKIKGNKGFWEKQAELYGLTIEDVINIQTILNKYITNESDRIIVDGKLGPDTIRVVNELYDILNQTDANIVKNIYDKNKSKMEKQNYKETAPTSNYILQSPDLNPGEYYLNDYYDAQDRINEKFTKTINGKKITDNKGLINYYHSQHKTGEYYLIDDKINNTTEIYKDGRLVRSFDSVHGANGQQPKWNKYQHKKWGGLDPSEADNYTITFEGNNGISKDSEGNMSTPAGIYYSNPTSNYKGNPAWTRSSDPNDIKGSYIASSIHFRPVINDNTFTNGCTGLSKQDLKTMKGILGDSKNIPTYIIPLDEEHNKFFIRNGVLNYRSTLPAQKADRDPKTGISYWYFKKYGKVVTDNSGRKIKTSPQLNGIKTGYQSNLNFRFDNVKDSGKNYDDFQKLVAERFSMALMNQKKQLMNDLKSVGLTINDDTYNKLATYALGILGKESSYGKTHSGAENLVRAAAKLTGSIFGVSTGGPDPWYEEKLTGGDLNKSLGLTQMRMSPRFMGDKEKKLYEKYKEKGIVFDSKALLRPYDCAKLTMIRLAQLYYDNGCKFEGFLKNWNSAKNYQKLVKERYEKDFGKSSVIPIQKNGGKVKYVK